MNSLFAKQCVKAEWDARDHIYSSLLIYIQVDVFHFAKLAFIFVVAVVTVAFISSSGIIISHTFLTPFKLNHIT